MIKTHEEKVIVLDEEALENLILEYCAEKEGLRGATSGSSRYVKFEMKMNEGQVEARVRLRKDSLGRWGCPPIGEK